MQPNGVRLPFEPTDSRQDHAHEPYDLGKLLQMQPADLSAGADFREFFRVAREFAQFGLLTTEERRSQYRDLATLMRQGTPAAEALKDAFGVSLEQLATELKGGGWRKDAQFRLTASGPPVSFPTPTKLDATEVNTLLQVVAKRAALEPPERM
jgi:hypothetical protein